MELTTQKTKNKIKSDKLNQKDVLSSESGFSFLYIQAKPYLDELVDNGKPEMWEITEKELWENFNEIETKWNEIADFFLNEYQTQNKTFKWIFFTDYPKTPLSYVYNSCSYKKNLLPNHLKRGIFYFNVIPLTLRYKSIESEPLKSAYRSLFALFKGYRHKNWQHIKELVDKSTHFGLFHKRQELYLSDIISELEPILNKKIHIDLWDDMHRKSFGKLDEIEKLMLFKA
jgi:hypothetical protein